MDTVATFFNSIGIDFDTFWKAALIFLIGTILLSVFGRFVFGKRSTLNHAVSSAIGVLFIYALTIVLGSAGEEFRKLIAPLPFVAFTESNLVLFTFQNAHYTTICTQLLSMIILAFLVNLADSWFPKGKNIFTWILFRCLTVILGYIMHLVVVYLFATCLPEGFLTYAPMILLVILVLLLLTGALKIIVGALMATVNPIIGALYTFFFANIIGKALTKAVLTTAILVALVFGLQYIGLGVISIASAALVAYIPVLLLLLVVWYLVILIF
ncbi:MAG: hypothetical protein J6Q54_02510 [Oscillospiraceae bacterium]|nr:hypothetical protein [Oscillospiraceae bacterium]